MSSIWRKVFGKSKAVCVKHNELLLYNSFTRQTGPVIVCGKKVYLNTLDRHTATAYVCGPTVYDDSHLGHAVTYIRFDLFRRVFKSYCGIDLISVMNVTDVDDKIISRANKQNCSVQHVSSLYLNSFLEDMRALNVLPPDALVRVTDKMDTIIKFIGKIEANGNAYVNDRSGDVCIKLNQLANYQTNTGKTLSTDTAEGKLSAEDFVLWKKYKKNEPFWIYPSATTKQNIKGRPGWHVECSAIAMDTLGTNIDFHFGGQDLFFPHHLNESACCTAWNNNLNSSLSSWVSNWVHFGQFIIGDQKMSKSLGNGVTIKSFLSSNEPQILRILCLINPYKRDIYYDEKVLKHILKTWKKLKMFKSLLQQEIEAKSNCSLTSTSIPMNVNQMVNEFRLINTQAIADNMNFHVGFQQMLDLADEFIPNVNKLNMCELVLLRKELDDYLESTGLIGQTEMTNNLQNKAIQKLLDFRVEVRSLALQNVKKVASKQVCQELLHACDQIRNKLADEHVIIADQKCK